MHQVALQYVGKKKDFKFANKRFAKPIAFYLTEPTWLPVQDAEWFLDNNPAMFVKVGEENPEEPVEDAAEIIKAKKDPEKDVFDELDDEILDIDDAPDLVCDKCGKTYKPASLRWYDEHIAKCEG